MKLSALVLVAVAIMVNVAQAQPGTGRGQGFRGGRGPGMQGRGQGAEQHDERHDADREVFQFLLSNHDKMKHENTDKGVRVTETSDDPYVAKIQLKVAPVWATGAG